MLNNFEEGQEVSVAFNISSREYNGKYYHNIDAWKIEPLGCRHPQEEKLEAVDLGSSDNDGLPF